MYGIVVSEFSTERKDNDQIHTLTYESLYYIEISKVKQQMEAIQYMRQYTSSINLYIAEVGTLALIIVFRLYWNVSVQCQLFE